MEKKSNWERFQKKSFVSNLVMFGADNQVDRLAITSQEPSGFGDSFSLIKVSHWLLWVMDQDFKDDEIKSEGTMGNDLLRVLSLSQQWFGIDSKVVAILCYVNLMN